MIKKLTSIGQAVEFEGEPNIIPLNSLNQTKSNIPEKKEFNIKDYIDDRCNSVAAFLIKWIKTEFVQDIFGYLNDIYKKQIKEEIINELK